LSYAGVGYWEGAYCGACGEVDPDCRCDDDDDLLAESGDLWTPA